MGEVRTPKERDLPRILDFFKEIYQIWISERPTQLAAALAYFGLFSFAPVIYIAFSIVGIFFREAEIIERFIARLESVLGSSVALAVESMLERLATPAPEGTFLVSLISILLLLYAASGVFFQLQYALNSVWKIPYSPQGAFLRMLRKHLFSFLMVIGVGLLLIAAAVLSFLVNWLSSIFAVFGILPSFTAVVFLVLAMLSFAIMYKLLPDTTIAWQDVWPGAAAAALLVTLGGWLILFFLENTSFASALEAAGSFVVLLTGFYYFSQIFLLGAIITRVYAQRYGSLNPGAAKTPMRSVQ
jgi:membrane protein